MPEQRDANLRDYPQPDVVREIAWLDVFPWLLLVRAFRISIQTGHLLLASAGVLLTVIGWWALAQVFGGTQEQPLASWLPAYQSCPWRDPGESAEAAWLGIEPEERVESPRLVPDRALLPAHPVWQVGPPRLGYYPGNPFLGAWQQLRAPFRQLFDRDLGVAGLAFLLLCCLWAAAVWALFGGAITRRAALQFGREESIGLKSAVRYAAGKWRSYFAAPLLPLFGVLIFACPALALGALMRIDLGLLAAAVVWPLAILASIVMALLLLALLFGWPLMWPTISTEGTDSFDALSRSWSYVYHRPLHYLFYAAVVTVLGGLGWLFVAYFAEWVIYLPLWAASWTAGNERMTELERMSELIALGSSDDLSMLSRWGVQCLLFWIGCVRLLALGFVYSYFWTASTGIYFLLRRDDDGTDLDDVHLEQADQAYGLPPLETDAAGVPTVAASEAAADAAATPAIEPEGPSGQQS